MNRSNHCQEAEVIEEILAGIQRGYDSCIGLLYKVLLRECFPKIVNYMVHRQRHVMADVEDWYQEVFFNLVRAIEGGKHFSSFGKTCAYMMQGVKFSQRKLSARNKVDLVSKETSEEWEYEESTALSETTQEVLVDTPEACKSLLITRFILKLPLDKLQQKELQACTKEFLQKLKEGVGAKESARSQLEEKALAALQKLDGDCGQLLRMYYLEGKKLKEIAELLGLGYKTTKNKKVNCMKQLIDDIGGDLL